MNKVEISGVNTSKLPLLTAEEKVELLKKVQQGDKKEAIPTHSITKPSPIET